MGQKGSKTINEENVEDVLRIDNIQNDALECAKEQYLNFPFLNVEATIDYVHYSKVMFILRGLSGSGKSTIANEISKIYENAVICSADEYFMRTGRYEFDPYKLKEAHEFCQEKARQACISNKNIVVIDNTNVQKWTMEYYFLLALKTCYAVILVEPQTPWKFNPSVLASKNQHGVGSELLLKKVEAWETVLPLYFGWLLNESDSRMMLLVGQAYLEECLQIPAFKDDFKNFSSLENIAEMLKYYGKRSKLLHCTAKFCNFGNVTDALEYSVKPEVAKGYGQCYDLCIIGFVITPRTFGARVKLSAEELKLWGSESPTSVMPHQNLENRSSCKNMTQNCYIDVKSREFRCIPDCRASLVCVQQSEISLQPTRGLGSRAHITLGCAEGIPPVTTGFDLMDIIDCEGSVSEKNLPLTFNLPRGVLRHYGESRWVLYTAQKIMVKSLFTGSY